MRRQVRAGSGAHVRAFTLVELLVVVSIIALLIAILLPSLTKARLQAKAVVCLANLKAMGQGLHTYASEWNGRLPGPLHPSVYRYQSLEYYKSRGYSEPTAMYMQSRQLTFLLRTTFRDSTVIGASITDKVTTCPHMVGLLPDSFYDSIQGRLGYFVFPTHYVINNWGPNSTEGGPVGMLRTTSPQYYYGFSPTIGQSVDPTSPANVGDVKRPSDEWAIADAWYRPRSNPNLSFLQQEGPYQSEWSGLAMANFAPHPIKFRRGYNYTDKNARNAESSVIRSGKQDGYTETLYFDTHAGPARSRSAVVNNFPVFYGFPGTVNPQLVTQQDKTKWNALVWE